MPRRLLATLLVLGAGCSKGHPIDDTDAPIGDDDADAPPSEIDAPGHVDPPDGPPGQPDAPPALPDAAHVPVNVTLAQTSDSTVTSANSASCNTAGVTALNSYYRAYTLAEHGVTGPLTISQVSFGVEDASDDNLGATQPARIKIYTYTGTVGTTLDTAQMSIVSNTPITIPNGSSLTVLNYAVSATIPSGTFVVELLIPDGDPDGDGFGTHFFIGSNTAAETKPSYIRAPDCSINAPSQVGTIGFANMHSILNVYGSYTP